MKIFHEFLPIELALIATNAMAEAIDDDATNWREQHAVLSKMLSEVIELGADRRELTWDACHHLDRYLAPTRS